MAHSPPEDNGVFATRAYWDARFAAEDEHDWLNTYAAYADLLRANVPDPDRPRLGPRPILVLLTRPRAPPRPANRGTVDLADGQDPRHWLRQLDAQRAAVRGRLPRRVQRRLLGRRHRQDGARTSLGMRA